MAKWYAVEPAEELDRLVAVWPDAPFERGDLLEMLLEVARDDVLLYAPKPAPDAESVDPPARYVLAQLRQAQNLWEGGRVDTDGNVGEGGFIFTPRPMDADIKKMIRPADGSPHVG